VLLPLQTALLPLEFCELFIRKRSLLSDRLKLGVLVFVSPASRCLATLLCSLDIPVVTLGNTGNTRIRLVTVFTTLFTFALAIFTQADKFGIFSATAAFAAAEVVYIGSTSLLT
jgi:hypothetical protein